MDKLETVTEQSGAGTLPGESLLIEQRRYRRFSTTLDVEICWRDEYGLPCVSPAVVKNVSAGGFGVALGKEPPVGSLLTVTVLKTSMKCVVRHVQPDHDAYLVGMEMLPASDGTTPTQSLQRLATALCSDRRTSPSSSDAPGVPANRRHGDAEPGPLHRRAHPCVEPAVEFL